MAKQLRNLTLQVSGRGVHEVGCVAHSSKNGAEMKNKGRQPMWERARSHMEGVAVA
ncbi:hypothetical protein BN844_0651 [Pseudomonas sp. SHC52]|nr:hypothetical protein BN844_0651 [Pseudomonas sp. SHC52]